MKQKLFDKKEVTSDRPELSQCSSMYGNLIRFGLRMTSQPEWNTKASDGHQLRLEVSLSNKGVSSASKSTQLHGSLGVPYSLPKLPEMDNSSILAKPFFRSTQLDVSSYAQLHTRLLHYQKLLTLYLHLSRKGCLCARVHMTPYRTPNYLLTNLACSFILIFQVNSLLEKEL